MQHKAWKRDNTSACSELGQARAAACQLWGPFWENVTSGHLVYSSGPLAFSSLMEQSSSLPPKRKVKTPAFSQLGPGGDRANRGYRKAVIVLAGEFKKRQNSASHVTKDRAWKGV